MLPPCFKPNKQTRTILECARYKGRRAHMEAMPLVRGKLIEIFSGPPSRSGYELTPDGEEALTR